MDVKDTVNLKVFEFKVPLNIGYGYCKIFDYRHIREFDGVLAKVFDCIVEKPLKDISILSGKDWLFGARRMPWLPNTRGKGAWKLRGFVSTEDENTIPDFKFSYQSAPFIIDESTIEKWYVIKNISESSDTPCTYEQVRHLEDTVITTQIGIEIRTAMEYCRINEIEIKEKFDLEQISNWKNYREMINVPIYKSIPKEIRGKALC